MTDSEKVIKGLELCKQDAKLCFSETECPYQCEFPRCCLKLMADALELLKEKEAMEQCLKTKCVICLHCDNCDVDENGILREQESIEPYMDYDGHDVWRCGNCGNSLMYPSYYASDEDAKNHIKYCSHCGKKVKWDG